VVGSDGTVTYDADLMKQVCRLVGKDALEFQAPEELGLLFWRRRKHTRFGRRQLRQDFAELAKLNNAGIGIFLEIAFSQGAKTHKLRVLLAQEIEIGFMLQSPLDPGECLFQHIQG
jgi:hypothetical protein